MVGAVLRVYQYLANSSLWLDEAALARNILDRPVTALLRSLDYAQSAPVGFLAVEKGIVTLFGSSEYAFRAFPLACGIVSLLLFWLAAKRVLSGWAATYAVGLFSLGTPFVYFSSQVKQYSSDIAFAILILLAAIEIRRRGVTKKRAWLLGVIGAVAVWFSLPALFVLTGIGAALVILVWKARDFETARVLLRTWFLWGVSSAAAGIFALRNVTPADREFFRSIWAEGFMPMPPRSLTEVLWPFSKLTLAFGAFASGMGRTNGGLNYRWSWVFAAMMLLGLWALWKRQRDVALFLALPIVVAVAASALKLYPFTARLFVFLLPSLLLAIAAGAVHLLSIWPPRMRFLAPAGLAVLGGAPLYAAATALPPYWLQHLRPIIEHVNTRRSADDGIYVYYGAGQAFHYYAKRYYLSLDDVVIGRCNAGNPREYLRELDYFRGKNRLWMIVSSSWRDGTEVSLMLEYLERLGRRLETMSIEGSGGHLVEAANGYLYDLSDRTRLDSVSSSTFPIVPSYATNPAGPWSCHGVFHVEPKRP